MKAYITADNAIWLVLGYQKQSPIAMNWMGEVKRLTKPYRQGWKRIARSGWLEARMYCSIKCGCGNSDYKQSLKKAVQHKKFLAK